MLTCPKDRPASVTETPCTCGYLQRAADDPRNPIIFDEDTSEYQFTFQEPESDGLSTLIIYHCPFCGGAAPESKRDLLFAQIPDSEQSRLAELLDGIETIDGALERFGKPDFEGTSVTTHPERENEPPRIGHHRDIRYHNLSNVAEIRITSA